MVGRILVLIASGNEYSTLIRPTIWLDELEYYTHCHLQLVLKFVQPFVGRIRILYSLPFAINTKNRPAIGWTIFSINMHKC